MFDAPALSFQAKMWLYTGKGAWYFVTLPPEMAEKVRFFSDAAQMNKPRRGFKSIKVMIEIGKTQWSTSLFPDKTSNSFLLPIRKQVRLDEGLEIGDNLNLSLTIL